MVSFTFYHDAKFKNEKKKNFSAGISGNLALVRRLYGAGWTMRLYYDLDPGPAGQLQLRQLCELACADPQLDLCRVRRLPGRPLEDAREVYPLLWRFLPSLDPQVSVFLSRDLDSRITAREVARVPWRRGGALHAGPSRAHHAHHGRHVGRQERHRGTRRVLSIVSTKRCIYLYLL